MLSSERYDRGKWHVGEINRRIADLCVDLQDKHEPWYIVTKNMEHKSCPIAAGVSSIS